MSWPPTPSSMAPYLLAALEIKARVEALGCAIVGPIGGVFGALEVVGSGPLDGALLDVSLHGRDSFSVGLALRAQRCPFCFISGYTDLSGLPEALKRTCPA
jgi:hypothetical protein